MSPDLVVHAGVMLFALSFMLGLGTVFTWVERKQSAITSDRIGANRCYVRLPFTQLKFVAWGLFHAIADGGKLLLKENFTPRTHDRACYNLAPWLASVPVMLLFAVIPFGGTLQLGEHRYAMQVAQLDAGILVVLAISGISVLGAMLAGWASNNKFSLLGAVRAAAQMISYELALGLALISMVVTYGTLDLDSMVRWQAGALVGGLPAWGVFVQPLAFLLVLTAGIAENKRVPFDLPGCESELIAGYYTEYSAMKMGLFMLTEFIEIVVISALIVTVFLGGYQVPVLAASSLSNVALVLLQIASFSLKTFLVGCFQIQIRWTLPRFRCDQLMAFGWRLLLPLAALNLIVTVCVLGFMGPGAAS
ncbi:MAG TPA: complex I subunit 1 family protein [Steroidobacteraceae bacterium]